MPRSRQDREVMRTLKALCKLPLIKILYLTHPHCRFGNLERQEFLKHESHKEEVFTGNCVLLNALSHSCPLLSRMSTGCLVWSFNSEGVYFPVSRFSPFFCIISIAMTPPPPSCSKARAPLAHCCILRALPVSGTQWPVIIFLFSRVHSGTPLPTSCLGMAAIFSLIPCWVPLPPLISLYLPAPSQGCQTHLPMYHSMLSNFWWPPRRNPVWEYWRKEFLPTQISVLWDEHPYKVLGIRPWGPPWNTLEAKIGSPFSHCVCWASCDHSEIWWLGL